MTFGEYIKKLREAKGMSLTVAARELGIKPQKLCDIEQGRRYLTKSPGMEMMRKIAAVYDHPFTHLVTNTEFFQYEKNIIADLLTELEPLAEQLERKSLDIVIEAKQYTPEMESTATECHALVGQLKLHMALAKAKFSRAPRPQGLETKRTRQIG